MAASNGGETVRVIVRCRPMNQRESDLKCQVNQSDDDMLCLFHEHVSCLILILVT
jgi:hypothetical protein